MNSDIDHFVFVVPDLTNSIEEFYGTTGCKPIYGGSHLGLGTHNAILPLHDGIYLELIAYDPNQSDEDILPFLKPNRLFGVTNQMKAPYLLTWASRTDNIAAVVASAKEQGYELGNVNPGSRTISPGNVLKWKSSWPMDSGGIVPFLIEWENLSSHPSKVSEPRITLSSLVVHHPRIEEIKKKFSHLRLNNDKIHIKESKSSSMQTFLETPKGSIVLGKALSIDNLVCRNAFPDDLDWINTNYNSIQFMTSSSHDLHAVAILNGFRIGQCRAVSCGVPGHFEVGGVYTQEAYRNLGVARKLVEYLLSHVIPKDATTLYIIPFTYLTEFYKTFGFELVDHSDVINYPPYVQKKCCYCAEKYTPTGCTLLVKKLKEC